jgi:outer membrane protein assembly factor BamB
MKYISFAVVIVCATVAGADPAGKVAPYRAPAHVPATGIGFRGDGTGVIPDAKPPTVWDERTGTNILWKVPLPNWGLGCPTPVGNRVLVMSEPSWVPGTPGCDWPELLCFDADTGALAWRQTVDPFLAFPEVTAEERQRGVEGISYAHSVYRKAYQVSGPIGERGGADTGSPEIAKANEELAPLGAKIDRVRMNYGQLRELRIGDPAAKRIAEADAILGKYGIVRLNTWDEYGREKVGTCLPTPVSDGERVFVMTVHGTVACYEIAGGKLLWCTSSRYRLPRSAYTMESPRLYGELLLTTFAGLYPGKDGVIHQAQAWDRRTGELRWTVDMPVASGKNPLFKDVAWASRGGASPLVLQIGSVPVLVTCFGNILRLPDGKLYDAKIGPALATWAVDPVTCTVFSDCSNDGGGPRFALELSLDAGDLVVKRRWVTTAFNGSQGGPSMVFDKGRLFWSCVQLDPVTGMPLEQGDTPDWKMLRGKGARSSPETRHVMLVANGYVYGLREGTIKNKDGVNEPGGIGEVYTVDGKPVAANVLTTQPRPGADWTDKWQAQGFPKQGFSYGCPFSIGGDRIYIRSEEWLYCIGSN